MKTVLVWLFLEEICPLERDGLMRSLLNVGFILLQYWLWYQYSTDQNQVLCCHLWWCSCARALPDECYFLHRTSEDWWRVHKVQNFRYNIKKIILQGLWKAFYFLHVSTISMSKEERDTVMVLITERQFSWLINISAFFSQIYLLCCALL